MICKPLRRGRSGSVNIFPARYVSDVMWHDFRYAIRTHQRNPGFAFGVLLVLIVGIGANTVIFSVINAVLLTPLPYPDPDRLVMLWQRNSQRGLNRERAQRGAVLRMV